MVQLKSGPTSNQESEHFFSQRAAIVAAKAESTKYWLKIDK